MFVMHFCLVCNMNKIGSVFVIYILVVVAAGAAELKSKSQSSSKVEQASKTKDSTTASKTSTPYHVSAQTKGSAIASKPSISYHVSTQTKGSPIASKASTPHHVSAHASYNNGMSVASIAGVDSRYGRLSSMTGVKFYPPIDSSMIKTDSKGNFIFKSTDGKMPMPITITKQGDGVSGTIQIMPGSVSVSSSANSGSASASVGPKISNFNPWSNSFMKPMMNDLFFPDPFPAFPSISNSAYHTRMSDSTFHRIPEPSFPRIPEPSFPRIPEPSFPRISEPSFPRISQQSYSRIQQPAYTPRMPDPWKNMFKHSLPQHDVMMSPGWYYPSFSPYFNFW